MNRRHPASEGWVGVPGVWVRFSKPWIGPLLLILCALAMLGPMIFGAVWVATGHSLSPAHERMEQAKQQMEQSR